MKKPEILFFTIGPRIMPSSRARVYIYEDVLKREKLRYRIIPAINTRFCEMRIRGKHDSVLFKPRYIINIVFHLLVFLLHVPFYDYIVIQKVMFPEWVIPFLRALFKNKTSYFDVDDLIYEPQKGENWSEDKVRRMKERFRKNLELYTGVITSTDFIKNELHRSFPDIDIAVHVIHDPVDTAIFSPRHRGNAYARPVIGWIGTPANTHYLLKPLESLERLYNNGVKFTLFLSGADNGLIQRQNYGFPVVFEEWRLENEPRLYDVIDIGLMPLSDDTWSRAKGGYKLLHYMAMGKIAVASAVGLNTSIIENRENGFLVYNDDEWYAVLSSLVENYMELIHIGRNARKKVIKKFSLTHLGRAYIALFSI